MARLPEQLLERLESFGDRVLDVVDALQDRGVSRRILDQISACGTSVGANAYEADEAMSRADFVKCLSVAAKELNESRYWLRLASRRKWVAQARLDPLLDECVELKKVVGSMIARTKARKLGSPR